MKEFADDDELNISEYARKIQRRRRRLTVILIILAVAVLAGMVLFWDKPNFNY